MQRANLGSLISCIACQCGQNVQIPKSFRRIDARLLDTRTSETCAFMPKFKINVIHTPN